MAERDSVVEVELQQKPVPEGSTATMPINDLGFGRVVAQRVRGRFLNKDGSPNSRKYGMGRQAWAKLYLRALAVSWP